MSEEMKQALEKASDKYSVNVYHQFLDNPNLFEDLDGEELLITAFKAGVQWYRGNILHDGSERPKEGSRICLFDRLTDGKPTVVSITYHSCSFEASVMLESEKWFYIDDLLPEKED